MSTVALSEPHTPSVHQLMKGQAKCSTTIQWILLQPQKGMRSDTWLHTEEPCTQHEKGEELDTEAMHSSTVLERPEEAEPVVTGAVGRCGETEEWVQGFPSG